MLYLLIKVSKYVDDYLTDWTSTMCYTYKSVKKRAVVVVVIPISNVIAIAMIMIIKIITLIIIISIIIIANDIILWNGRQPELPE